MATTAKLSEKAKEILEDGQRKLDPGTGVLVVLVTREGFGSATNLPGEILARIVDEVGRRAKRRASEGLIVVPSRGPLS